MAGRRLRTTDDEVNEDISVTEVEDRIYKRGEKTDAEAAVISRCSSN